MKLNVWLYKFLATIFWRNEFTFRLPAKPDFENANVRTFFEAMRTHVTLHGRARALIARAITGMTPGVVADLTRILTPL